MVEDTLQVNIIKWLLTFLLTLTVYQTYIGPVLVSVNPFKMLNIYTDKEIDQYQGAVSADSIYTSVPL